MRRKQRVSHQVTPISLGVGEVHEGPLMGSAKGKKNKSSSGSKKEPQNQSPRKQDILGSKTWHHSDLVVLVRYSDTPNHRP